MINYNSQYIILIKRIIYLKDNILYLKRQVHSTHYVHLYLSHLHIFYKWFDGLFTGFATGFIRAETFLDCCTPKLSVNFSLSGV